MKICFFCEHIRMESGRAYSELTWQSGCVRCALGHWDLLGDDLEPVDIGKELIRAEKCVDYKPQKGVPA